MHIAPETEFIIVSAAPTTKLNLTCTESHSNSGAKPGCISRDDAAALFIICHEHDTEHIAMHGEAASPASGSVSTTL